MTERIGDKAGGGQSEAMSLEQLDPPNPQTHTLLPPPQRSVKVPPLAPQ
jgi:hypothetical protein